VLICIEAVIGVMTFYVVLRAAAILGRLSSASVTVRKTSTGPTGYDVAISYLDTTAANVTIGGGFPTFTDEFHTSPDGSAQWDPHQYKPGWFPEIIPDVKPYRMMNDDHGNWSFTTPLPSGTYIYAFQVNCSQGQTCSNIVDTLTTSTL
jgi:hypothetical protein